jgi:hypothetical protein
MRRIDDARMLLPDTGTGTGTGRLNFNLPQNSTTTSFNPYEYFYQPSLILRVEGERKE